MILLTPELRQQLPPIYSTENLPKEEKRAICKFFTPDSCWTWYALEFDPEEGIFFGIVEGLETEWGYFSLEDLQSIRGPLRLPVERDMWFEPTPVDKLKVKGLIL